MNRKYDIIGDIHGYATKLKALLTKLGYCEEGGTFHHPERKVIFLGDFIDRGPEIRETLRVVRKMVDSGNALAVMGNHEFNALAFHTPDGKGGYLRKHTREKIAQHQATLDQVVTTHPIEWAEWLNWFSTLPLFLDLGRLRAVHAAWDKKAVAALSGLGEIRGETLLAMTQKGSLLHRHREVLLCGLEIPMPEGLVNPDKEGVKRNSIRTRWWEPLGGKTYRQAVFPDAETVPNSLIPADLTNDEIPYDNQQPPVFFGHYWMPPMAPKVPLASNVAVLDYSVAKGGELTAYRWNGESSLTSQNYIQ